MRFLPGENLTSRNRLVRMLAAQDAAAPPIQSHAQGLAHLLRQGLIGYNIGADERDRSAAYRAMIEGLTGGGFVDPKTGTMTPGAGGLRGAQSVLSRMTDNEYAQGLLPQFAMASIQRQQTLADAQRQRQQALEDEKRRRDWAVSDTRQEQDFRTSLARMNRETSLADRAGALVLADRLARERERDAERRKANRERAKYGLDPLLGAGTPTIVGPATAPPPDLQTAAGPAPVSQTPMPPGIGPAGLPSPPRPPQTLADAKAASEARAAARKAAAQAGGVSLTPAQKKADEAFGKEYAELFAGGGLADVQKNLGQLDEVVTALEGGRDDLTGTFIGNMPESVRQALYPEAQSVKDTVEEVVQRNLRLVLGAQFTQQEGERLIARAYNPALSEAENAKRVRRLRDSIKKAYDAKIAAAQYYQRYGTLQGYEGSKAFTAEDIARDAFGGQGTPQDDVPPPPPGFE